MRLGLVLKAMLLAGLTLRLHHHFHGSPIGYAGLAAAAAASWIGVPGPGEPILIAAGVLAAKHKLDIASVLVVAWAGATAGGIGGWLIGLKAGRAFVSAPGPLLNLRLRALARGEQIFTRVPVVAVVLTPSWIAGIHGVGAALYLPTNAGAAVVWTLGIGLGAYYVGPAVVDLVADLGWVTGIGLALLILAGVGAEVLRRRRHSGARDRTAPERDRR